MMEFDEMRKIWDEQSQKTVFAIDEAALHRQVKKKDKKINRSILMMEISLLVASLFVVTSSIFQVFDDNELYELFPAGILLLACFYFLRIKRQRAQTEEQFDASIRGDLERALFRLEYIKTRCRALYLTFYGVILVTVLIKLTHVNNVTGTLIGIGALIGLGFGGWYMMHCEWRKCFAPRERELKSLQTMFTEAGIASCQFP